MPADWRDRRCETCDFWERSGHVTSADGADVEPGLCQRHAPRPDHFSPPAQRVRWPLTMSVDGSHCGDWRPLPVVQGAPCARVEAELAEARAEVARLRRALLEAEEESGG